MQPRLLKTGKGVASAAGKLVTDHGAYDRAAWTGRNESGIAPIFEKVVILVDQVEPRTAGGIIITDESQERANLSAESGVIVAVGPLAFRFDGGGRVMADGEIEKPGAGTHVWFQKFSGAALRGRDGRTYRVMDDTCIGAVALPDEAHDPFLDDEVPL